MRNRNGLPLQFGLDAQDFRVEEPRIAGVGGVPTAVSAMVPAHTGVSCSDCWLSTFCVALEAWRPWLILASQGPSETLRPEDCTGPLFRGLRPPQGPAGPGTHHSASAGGWDRGRAAPGQRQAHTALPLGPGFLPRCPPRPGE